MKEKKSKISVQQKKPQTQNTAKKESPPTGQNDKVRNRSKSPTKGVWVTREMANELGREYVLMTTIKETLFFLIFVIITTTVNLGFASSSMYHLHQVINQQMLLLNNFQNINTASDFWTFIHSAFTRSPFWDYWYYPSTKLSGKYARTVFYENTLLGVPRLRQLRVRNDSCTIPGVFRDRYVTCYGRFNRGNEFKSSFGLGLGTAWNYHSEKELRGTGYQGKLDYYHGGGYYQEFSLDKKDTLGLISKLQNNLWISRETRAVFFDFSVYNANNNLFCITRAVFEFPSTGGILASSTMHVIKLLRYSEPYDYFLLSLEVLHVCFIIFYTTEEIRELVYFKAKYFTIFWTYVDLGIITLGYAALGLGIANYFIANGQIQVVVANPELYANLEVSVKMQVIYCNIMALQLFIVYLKVFKYLNFNRSMAQLNNTLARCKKDLMGFGIMFSIIFSAFSALGNLLFGKEVDDFSTFYSSMFTLLRTILGDFDYTEIEKANRVLAPVFFFCFIFLVFFVLLNMFLAIINDTYTEVKIAIKNAPEEMQMGGFLRNGFNTVMAKIGLKRFTRKVKDDAPTSVESKITENEIKAALKKLGFSDLEIDMFFSRYNIDPNAEVKKYDIQKLIDALAGKVDEAPPVEEQKQFSEDGSLLVGIDNFTRQQEKLDEVEEALVRTTAALNKVLMKLESLENVRKIKVKK